MSINEALNIFYKSEYSKIKIGNKKMDAKIESYAIYKNEFLLIPVHANFLPDSYLYLISANGTIKTILPIEIARSNENIKIIKV